MIFNFWREYPRRKPKEEARYLVRMDDGELMVLTYIPWKGRWICWERLQVFEGYRIFKHTGTLDPDNQIYSDGLCDLTDSVVRWKKIRRREKTNG